MPQSPTQTQPERRRSAFMDFDPLAHTDRLVPLLEALRAAPSLDSKSYQQIIRRHPPSSGGAYSKSEVIRAYRLLSPSYGWTEGEDFVSRLRMKPVRTLSGVAPVTVLTKPFPCPGKCIFCPSDVRMPKSYLSREPGAQRAAQHRFDPYGQTLGRLLTFHHNGHRVDKVEMIVLGGTWSFYPEEYQLWFIKRCFDAMNDFDAALAEQLPMDIRGDLDWNDLEEEIDGEDIDRTYNQVIRDFLGEKLDGSLLDDAETATWAELEAAHRANEAAEARCVGLVVETRPDHVTVAETEHLRRLGCTKVQIGVQSLDDAVLAANRRGHDVASTRQALHLLRQAGFKLHVHWMPNLFTADVASDAADFPRLFEDPAVCPDELKIYPCSLIETAELMQPYRAGTWRPYSFDELTGLLEDCLIKVPEYCRVTRVIRDIPGDEIVDGNQVTNFREVVERRLRERGLKSRDIRAREIRGRSFDASELELRSYDFETTVGQEHFLQFTSGDDSLVGFCRLSLPKEPVPLAEIATSAMIREVHVYGGVVGFDGDGRGAGAASQHRGLGRRLVEHAADIARDAGYADLAVISAIGTRDYYRGLGFADGALAGSLDRVLYMHRNLRS